MQGLDCFPRVVFQGYQEVRQTESEQTQHEPEFFDWKESRWFLQ